MESFFSKLSRAVDDAGLTFYKLQFPSGVPSSRFSNWKKEPGHKDYRAPTDEDLQKLANVPDLGVTLEELLAWRLMDDITDSLPLGTYSFSTMV